MTFSVTWLSKQGHSRTEYVTADSLFLAVKTCQLLDDVARVQRIVQVPTAS